MTQYGIYIFSVIFTTSAMRISSRNGKITLLPQSTNTEQACLVWKIWCRWFFFSMLILKFFQNGRFLERLLPCFSFSSLYCLLAVVEWGHRNVFYGTLLSCWLMIVHQKVKHLVDILKNVEPSLHFSKDLT